MSTGAAPTHRCHQGGRLAPAAEPIPDDPADYVWAPTVRCGCNALVCGSCGEPVSWRTADDGAGREYRCACASKVVHSWRWIEDWPADQFTDSVPDWHCGGHPARQPPFELDGVRIEAAPDWRGLLEAAAKGERHPSQLPEFLPSYPLGWLERFAATVAPGERARFDGAAAELLDELAGEALRDLLDLVRLMGLPEATTRVVQRVASGAADAWLADDALSLLVVKIVEGAAGPASTGAPVVEAMRRLLDSPARGAGGLVWPLAERDASWLAAHAPALLARDASRGSHLFAALEAYARGALTQAIDGALSAGVGRRTDLERAIGRCFQEPERSRWLERLANHPADP